MPKTASPARAPRPLSPHLSIYKPQLTSGMSIFHKITGIALAVFMAVIVAWLAIVAWLPEWHDPFKDVCTSWFGRLLLMGWSWAFFYHFGCGVRYLFWATGRGLSLKDVYRWGYVALAFSFLATLALWTTVFMAGEP